MDWLGEPYETPAQRKEKNAFPHYYGDIVRGLFVVGGIIMLVSLPAVQHLITVPIFVSLFSILLLALLAGLTSPRQKWASLLDVLVSLCGFLIFEYYAITRYTTFLDYFFLVNQLLAIIYFVALYYSVKTLRWLTLDRKNDS